MNHSRCRNETQHKGQASQKKKKREKLIKKQKKLYSVGDCDPRICDDGIKTKLLVKYFFRLNILLCWKNIQVNNITRCCG